MVKTLAQKEIKEMTNKIVIKFKPKKVILFGSYAWGKPNVNSDVDLFVVKETKSTRKTAMEIDGYLFPRTMPIDIVVYRPSDFYEREKAGDFFINDIISKGKILYEQASCK